MKKFKMLSTISSIALCIAVMVFGVMAANQVTFSISSTISYTVEDVFVDIETRIYSCNKLFASDEELADYSVVIQGRCQNFGNPDFDALDAEGFYTLTPVDLGQDGEDSYLYKFTSTSPSDTPDPLELDLEYLVEDEIYSYFMVIRVENLSSIPLYSFVKNEEYVAPGENNLAYKQEDYIALEGKGDCGYIIFAIGLEDMTRNAPESTFNFPIEVSKEEPNFERGPAMLSIAEADGTINSIEIGETTETSMTLGYESEISNMNYHFAAVSDEKMVALSGIDTSMEAVRLSFNNNANTYVGLYSASIYESLMGLENANIMAGEAMFTNNGAQMAGEVEGFYGASVHGVGLQYDFENFVFGENNYVLKPSVNYIEIPTSALNSNGSLEMVMLVVSSVGTGNVALEVTIEYVEEYEPVLYELSDDGASYIYMGYKNYYAFPTNGVVDIPATYKGVPVTEIGFGAVFFCPVLLGVNISEGITKIGAWAFASVTCGSIVVPSTVTEVGEYALEAGSITIKEGTTLSSAYPLGNDEWYMINENGEKISVSEIPTTRHNRDVTYTYGE